DPCRAQAAPGHRHRSAQSATARPVAHRGGRMSNGMTLREQLGVSAEPDFEIDLPPGWERRDVGDDDRTSLEAALRQKFLSAQRPDLYAGMRAMLDSAYTGMASAGAIAYYAATTGDENTLWIPG